jgi:hypothetical protein
MKKAVTVIILGMVCLFLFSITFGVKVFSAWEKRMQAEKRLETQYSPEQRSLVEKETRSKKIRLSMNPFDLANGLTFQELENLSLDHRSRLFAFIFLLTSVWMAWGLRRSRSRS